MTYEAIEHCLLCGGTQLRPVLDLGLQPLSSVFPELDAPDPAPAPLRIVQCTNDACGSVQMGDKASFDDMYGFDYGYNSSLSPYMVEHLAAIHSRIRTLRPVRSGDVVLDVGCNDGTLLKMFADDGIDLIGVDPSAARFLDGFPAGAEVVLDFFPSPAAFQQLGDRKVAVLTSIAMFYDLYDPRQFVKSVFDVLTDDGLWVVELAEFNEFLKNLSYDQICHEHLLYIDNHAMVALAESCGFHLVDITYSEINGGSACYYFAKLPGGIRPDVARVTSSQLDQLSVRVQQNRIDVQDYVRALLAQGRTIWGYGASTKGNVLQNFYGLTDKELPFISDLNPYKRGRITPGSRIPIVGREEFRTAQPDYALCFIWHLREEVLQQELEYIEAGGSFIFPLPRLHVVNKDNLHLYANRPLNDLAFDISGRALTI